MRIFLMFFILCGFVASAAHPAYAVDDFRPIIIYEADGGDDKAFIGMMKKGAQRARTEVGIDYQEARMPEGSDRVQFIKGIAESGVSHIIAVGFQNVVPVLALAEQYPEVKFTVIDGIVPPLFQNVQSIVFKDQEGAFLVGMIAGYLSPTNKIGFIGGMDVPLINNFALGFFQGAKYANKDVEMLRDTVGDNPAAWSNPERAKTLAKKQFNNGTGVIFAAAGGSSVGVLEAAEEMGRYAIGVDTNQNGLFPGTVLTSMVKRVDKAVYETLTNGFSGRWEPGIKYLGIRENALDYAVDVNNKNLINKDVIDKVEDAKDRIIRGLIEVETYEPM
ncbi:MAG: BMP family ABC transporter substrate-binding protein [Rickettsiales bacterium]|nr:BMP family ABC transporter substrate-binding protein [Rickettsiales bacterium]